MDSTILKLEDVEVSLGGRKILREISLEIRKGEQWAILGPSGSGKTVLARTLAGQHFFQGRISGSPGESGDFQRKVLLVEQQHRFKHISNQADFYYQQRYNSYDANGTINVQENLADYPEKGSNGFYKAQLIDLFQLRKLLTEPLIQLSNGENKRLQIVKALLTDHDLLVLDQPFTGLDAEGRKRLSGILNQLGERGEQMILITSGRDMPACFRKVLVMDQGKVVAQGSPEDFQSAGSVTPILPEKFPSRISFQYPDFEYAVRMLKVNVRYDEKFILRSIDWEVEKGSCWSLSGPNGAGKSTLLSLITGDNPQAYANEIYLFDRKRGTGESIWDIKQKTGFLSPELHLYFDSAATAYSTIASGLWSTTGLFRTPPEAEHELILEWLDFLDLDQYRNHLLGNLPAGIQRMLLLGRAMVRTPPLLVLDEPCQGLDPEHIEQVKGLIGRYCENYGASLIFVSHYPEELPACITRFLRLEKGAIL
ncbi:MAG: ATP-binding cassette domain-containing protein [Chitinophagales bacterium]